MDRFLAALAAALPDVGVRRVDGPVVGYASQRWRVATDHGTLLAKLSRLPTPPDAHVDGQRRAQTLLRDAGFPTPDMLFVGSSEAYAGRQFSVQRYVDAVAADHDDDAVMNALPPDRRRAFFVDFGRAVGLLHTLDLHDFEGWRDDDGVAHRSWAEAIFPEPDLRRLRDHPSQPLSDDDLHAIERHLGDGLAALDTSPPRLVHRDLHLGNVLLADGQFAGVVDFDLVREWDPVWDFAVRLDGAFEYWKCREPFMAGYRQFQPEQSADFDVRRRLYAGIDRVRTASEYLAGNHGVNSPAALRDWLATEVRRTGRRRP